MRPQLPTAASELFVDFAVGNDSAAGTKLAPLKTIAAAVHKVPALTAPRTIWLVGEGVHQVAKRVVFGPEHSHLTIANIDPATPAIVSGGVWITPTWRATTRFPTPIDNSTIYQASIDIANDGFGPNEVLELFNPATQARLIPARFPNGNPELDQSNYYLRAQGWLPPQQLGNATVVHNTSFARGGMYSTYRVGMGGPAQIYDPPISYWAVSNPPPSAGGGATFTIPSGIVVNPPPAGSATDGANITAGGRQGYAFVKQTYGWGSWVWEINETTVNGSAATMRFGRGGFQEARGTSSSHHPGNWGGPLYLSHRKDLLDVADEWFLEPGSSNPAADAADNTGDAGSATLYLAVANGQRPPVKVVAPMVDELFSLQGSQTAPVVGLHIVGLTLRHARPTFMDAYTVPSGGDYAVRFRLFRHTLTC